MSAADPPLTMVGGQIEDPEGMHFTLQAPTPLSHHPARTIAGPKLAPYHPSELPMLYGTLVKSALRMHVPWILCTWRGGEIHFIPPYWRCIFIK